MSNFALYRKTFGFSLRRIFWDIMSVFVLLALSTVGFIIAEKAADNGPIGLLIGALVGLVVMVVILRFASYRLKAGQIAMMTRGITEGSLPDNVIQEGKKTVKERFLTVAAYFAGTKVIKGIFNQLGNVITKVGDSLGGDTGNAIGSAISTIMSTMVSYLCDCCLGWVFFRKEVKSGKATCEGAVIFFKHGKTLLKNMGRIFGMGIASLLVIGGVFTGIFYLILANNAEAFSGLYSSIAEAAAGSEDKFMQLLQNPATIPVALAIIGGVIVWAVLHSTLIKPFVFAGVLRNYLESGVDDIPSEESFQMLDQKSAKFRQLHESI